MLLPCFAVALLAVMSTLDSNAAIEDIANEAVDEHSVVAKVREEFSDLLTIGEAEIRGDRVERTFEKQVGTVLAAYDEAQSVLDPIDDETLWKSRQHVLDLVAHSTALDTGELDIVRFRALADTDALEAFADLDAINRVGSEDFVADTGRRVRPIEPDPPCSSVRCSIGAVAATMLVLRHLRRALYVPLRDLELGLEQFVVDGLGHRIEVKGDREFRSVAGVVNTMASDSRTASPNWPTRRSTIRSPALANRTSSSGASSGRSV